MSEAVIPLEPISSDDKPAEDNTQLYIELLEFLKLQLPEVAGYVESKAVGIVDEFKDLSVQTMDQSKNMEQVVHIARSIELDGEEIPYEKSVEILYEPLAEAITKILQVSKLAMSMVMTIGNAADNIDRVERCIDDIQKLTRQTNMLAMNTQIEAARAGEAGKSFRIIAQEVKNLSESIKSISQQIQLEVGQVSSSVKKSSEVVDNLAYYDMTDNLELKDKIDGLIESIMDQNKRFSALLQDSAEAAQRTSSTIAGLVVGIQFQDRTSQVLGDMVSLIDRTIAHLHATEGGKKPSGKTQYDMQALEQIVGDIKLSEIRNRALEYLHTQGALDEESELYQKYVANQKQSGADSEGEGGDDDEDDIELF